MPQTMRDTSSPGMNSQPVESTLVLIKPDAVAKKLTGTLLSLYEQSELTLQGLRLLYPSLGLLEAHYAEHAGKPFLQGLLSFMQEGPVVAVVLAGENAIERVRHINGATDPVNAGPGTVRALYGSDTQRNCVHGSATAQDAQREIALWFPETLSNTER